MPSFNFTARKAVFNTFHQLVWIMDNKLVFHLFIDLVETATKNVTITQAVNISVNNLYHGNLQYEWLKLLLTDGALHDGYRQEHMIHVLFKKRWNGSSPEDWINFVKKMELVLPPTLVITRLGLMHVCTTIFWLSNHSFWFSVIDVPIVCNTQKTV